MHTSPQAPANSKYTIWLLPQEPERSKLQEQVSRLSAQEEVPTFGPHVTLYAGSLETKERTLELLQGAAKILGPLTLQAQGIESSSELTKSVYIQFEASERLSQVCEWLRENSAEASDYQLNPHLSLLYVNTALDKKRSIAESEELLQREFHFDALQAFSMPESFSCPESVSAFEEICHVSLR